MRRSRSPAIAVWIAALVAADLAAPAAAVTAGGKHCVARSAPIRTGITRASRTRKDRVVTLHLRSRAMGDVQVVNVLLPPHYDASGATRYPVVYLLHGAGGNNRSWLDDGDAQAALGSLPVIAVMPDGSGIGRDGKRIDGDYSDWFGEEAGSAERAPAWESFHIRELVPFIDRTFPTRASAAGRAIAGISMGGTGAMKYAAEYPGTFGAAGSFSGGIDLSVARSRDHTCKFGQYPRDAVVWRDNDPTVLAGNLRGVRLFVRSGDGTPGPFDAPVKPADPIAGTIWQIRLLVEAGANLMAEHFVAAARHAGVTGIDVRSYHGSHSHPYWRRELGAFRPWLRAQFRHPAHRPTSFSVASAHRSFTAWEWTFRTDRRTRAFLHLHVVARRLVAKGSGQLHAVTPRTYRPRRRYVVRSGSRTRTVVADRFGRLAFSVDLGAGRRVTTRISPANR